MKHKCDNCGREFEDDMEDMEHYANDNGLMLCGLNSCKTIEPIQKSQK